MAWWNKPEEPDQTAEDAIPVLTEALSPEEIAELERAAAPTPVFEITEEQLTELRADLLSRTYDLADQLVHTAFRDMEAALFEQVSNRLREQLPELFERVLGDHLDENPE
ncbi:MAG: hypothetical protein ACWGPN_15845 [Gammaproteobacteria bacterium]|jgi:hypothetical protein